MTSTISEKRPQFVLFGDSLTEWSFDEHTEGFGWFLKKWYQGRVDIINEGHAGYTSESIKHDFSTLIERITAPNSPRTLLFTIFLGANDACFLGASQIVPLLQFEENIREFVETILIQDRLKDAKIVLITTPPINISEGADGDKLDNEKLKELRGYRTYLSKKKYAQTIMQIAREYEETERVVGVDFWAAMVNAMEGRQGEHAVYDDEKSPGCGLHGVKAFPKGYFTDGLHLGKLGYNVLSKELLKVMLEKWPDLAPDGLKA